MDKDDKQELLKRADELIEENRRLREQLRAQQAWGRLLRSRLHRNPASEQQEALFGPILQHTVRQVVVPASPAMARP